ncbi:MAG: N-acetylmuramoyl-L-alanine amidase [Bacteroidetes bacterium]|nr:N-acetylmuramoyl-L-alanine amidase [Bacteroidota bacterium]
MHFRLLLIISIIFTGSFSALANGKKITKIVLDAGHGGQDMGAPGQFSHEKDLTLAITLRLGKIIKDSMPGMQVIYTRTTDEYPSLKDRHEIANQSKADLFLAIHINAAAHKKNRELVGYRVIKRKGKRMKQPIYKVSYIRTTQAHGTESYVLGLHRTGQNEDAISEYSETVADEPGLLNEEDPMTAIIVAQYSSAFLDRSVNLATKIQNQFEWQGRLNMGVKQKGLEVLAGSAMPGVLVECGFINNPEEEVYMNSDRGQFEIALAIFRGIRAYKEDAER